MIELAPEQTAALPKETPVSVDLYERLRKALYDDSPWTDEEMDVLAGEAGELLDIYEPPDSRDAD